MKYRYGFYFFALALFTLYTTSCRTDWSCQCMMIDSAGRPTSSASYDYGTISYSKAQAKCNSGNQVWDTCELQGYK